MRSSHFCERVSTEPLKQNPPILKLVSPVVFPILCMKERENGVGRFILRKKQAGRSTELEFVTEEKEGVLGVRKREETRLLAVLLYF